MALITVDMFGNKQDKVEVAIKRLKTFEPCEGYYVADLGGKDSCTAKALCALAGVKHDSHYSATTVDPPELVRFIREYHKDTEIIKPELSMRKLIIMKQFPPTRFARYCCEYLKEPHGSGRVTVTGVRWAESKNRRNNQGLATFTDPTKELLDYCSMLFAVLLVISVIKIDESKARERKRTHENHLFSSQSGCVRVHF